jgi:uncharacterized repeat protein (TIGR03803 family)
MRSILLGLIAFWTACPAQGVGLLYGFQLGPRNPEAGLILGTNGCLYGTSYSGGSNGYGTIFEAYTNGGLSNQFSLDYTNGTLTTLTNFNYLNGASPQGSLLLASDGNFYGTTFTGGYTGNGTIFRVTDKGGVATLTNLHIFDLGDGSGPCGGLVESNGVLYGTTSSGGNASSYGTIFCIKIGSEFMSLLAFDNFNGSNPQAGLTVGNGLFYGTTYGGGIFGLGTVFSMTADGALTTLAAFDGPSGANPQGVLVIDSDGNLYGTTANGGEYGVGTVFQITPNGEFTSLLSLNPGGAFPSTGLVAANGNLYGAISYGGQANSAMVFGLSELGIPQMLVPINGPYGATPVGTLAFIGGNVRSTNITTTYATATNTMSAPPYKSVIVTTNIIGIITNGMTNGIGGTGTNSPTMTNFALTGTLISTNIMTNTAVTELPSGAMTTVTITMSSNNVMAATNVIGTNTITMTTNLIMVRHTNYLEVEIATNATVGAASVTLVSISNTVTTTVVTVSNSPAIYGATFDGGASDLGTVFAVGTNGVLTNLVSFAMANGAHPLGGLIQGSDGNLYGTTSQGGPANLGTVFKVSLTNGGGLTVLAEFDDDATNAGAFPEGALAQGSNGVFYGTAYAGGAHNQGAIFMLNTNGVLSTLFSFGGTDGINPETGVIIDSEGNLLGTSSAGGTNGDGTVFKFSPDSNTISTFSMLSANGQNPQGPLVPGTDGYYYGTAESGGASNYGTVFKVNSNFKSPPQNVFSFYPAMGIYPNGGLVLGAGSNIFGTTSAGGTNGGGTVFCVTSTLAYSVSRSVLTLAWLVNSTITNLQATSDMAAPWSDAGAGAAAFGGWYQLQMPTTNGPRFFRLAPNRH